MRQTCDNEAEGGEQHVQPQYTNINGIVEKNDKNATSHLRGTINRKKIIEKPLYSVVARANIPRGNITNKGTKIATRQFNFVGKSLPPCEGKGIKKTVVPPSKPYNSPTASESNFGGKPPPWHAKGIGRTVVPPPKPHKKSMIEGGSNVEILESIIQDAKDMPREAPSPPILRSPILRPVKQRTVATASQQKSSQCSGETATSDGSREGSASQSTADGSRTPDHLYQCCNPTLEPTSWWRVRQIKTPRDSSVRLRIPNGESDGQRYYQTILDVKTRRRLSRNSFALTCAQCNANLKCIIYCDVRG